MVHNLLKDAVTQTEEHIQQCEKKSRVCSYSGIRVVLDYGNLLTIILIRLPVVS